MLYTDGPLPYKYGGYFDKNNRFTCFQLLLFRWAMNTPIAHTRCQSCGASMQTEYVRLGAVARCPRCSALMVPRIPHGGRIPIHCYEVTYADFLQLIEDVEYGKAISPLLDEWFACLVVVDGQEVVVKNRAGEKIDTLSLHLSIQADPIRQRVLYDTAMSLWR